MTNQKPSTDDMGRMTATGLALALLAACNAQSPTALSNFNPVSIKGKFSATFSQATCQVGEIQLSIAQFSDGGAVPDTIKLFGSWQTLGQNSNVDLVGHLVRDTGKIGLDLIPGVRHMEGLVLDNDHFVLAYTDTTTPCAARVSVRRID